MKSGILKHKFLTDMRTNLKSIEIVKFAIRLIKILVPSKHHSIHTLVYHTYYHNPYRQREH